MDSAFREAYKVPEYWWLSPLSHCSGRKDSASSPYTPLCRCVAHPLIPTTVPRARSVCLPTSSHLLCPHSPTLAPLPSSSIQCMMPPNGSPRLCYVYLTDCGSKAGDMLQSPWEVYLLQSCLTTLCIAFSLPPFIASCLCVSNVVSVVMTVYVTLAVASFLMPNLNCMMF